MNKHFVKLGLILLTFIIIKSKVFALSDNFLFIIDTIGIPRYNVYMEEINEDIYYSYNIFAYSNPENLLKHKDQRFKLVPNKGKWTKNSGAYKGEGERGEYYLLGRSYSGAIISNVYFPPDFLPETTPDKWNFIITSGALDSWFDKGKYRYQEQLEYMKSTDLLFDKIDYKSGTIDSYNLVPYGISVNKIGLNKMTLDTASTWKTNGIVTARRLAANYSIRHAIFATKPMAADASVLSNLNIESNYVMEGNEDEILIPIEFSASAINLSDNAKIEHIKEIVSKLYIDNKEVAKVSGSKTLKVDKKILYKVSRSDYSVSKTYPINIKIESYLYTEFNVDGLMQNKLEKTIHLQVKDKNVIPIKDVGLSVLEKEDNNLVVRPLVQTLYSSGIIEKGKFMAVKIKKGDEIINFNLYLNEKPIYYEELFSDNNYIIIKLHIEEELENTIKSWNYLRNETKNYFDINFGEIGNRIKNENQLKIKCDSGYEEILTFDTIDKYSNNMNFLFNKDVLNADKVKMRLSFSDWILNEK